MTVWVYRNGRMVEKRRARPRSVVHIISDHIPDMVHPANGKRYDSKSTFRRVTKDHGYVEVGTEKQADRRRMAHQDHAADVMAAAQKVNGGYAPHTDRETFSGDGWQ